ncbi:hypothetical protein AVEN_211406-1 [Araneus ventricosus]|uniref:Uncharacterized protein n=1 Tax=Araneus ventricosus TaxID=182803 RepID=A0A4Y2USE1_ARAVE|nr:hypothetical protein AVEN_183523-1 [Araneus ventricosus]GBO15828.1 hypothetical protein AVEN_211406-1 [Araneus ventricosus]
MKFQLKPANYTIKHSSVHDSTVTSQKNKVAKILKQCISYIFINSEIGPKGNFVCRFVISSVNFGAADYVDLIDWHAFYVTRPTVLRNISSYGLLKMIQDDVPMEGWDFIKFPSPTTAVERIVKLVTKPPEKELDRRIGTDLSELQ